MEAKKHAPASHEKKSRSDVSSAESTVSTPRDPIYPSQSPSNLTASDNSTTNAGIPNLEASENFGSRYQMPETQTSDNFLTSPDSSAEHFGEALPIDVQATVDAMTQLVHRIRANLESAEQQELEELLREGADMLSAHYKTLSHVATEQFTGIKSELRENPYRSLMTAVKIGMALSQVYSQYKESRSLSSSTNSVHA